MRAENKKACAAYEAKLAKAYYTSPQFAKDTAIAARNRGAAMGVRQAVGFIFIEIWMAAKEELQTVPANSELKDMLTAVANGVKKRVENAKYKYKELFAKFGEGFTAGALEPV